MLKTGNKTLNTKGFSIQNILLLIGSGVNYKLLINKNLQIFSISVQVHLVLPFKDSKECKVTEETLENF